MQNFRDTFKHCSNLVDCRIVGNSKVSIWKVLLMC